MTDSSAGTPSRDSLSYTEKIFFSTENGNLVPKKTVRIDCSDGLPDSMPEDQVCLLLNYKRNLVRGRKDPLKGRTVLAFHTEKGWVYLPFEEAMVAATYLHSYAFTLSNLLRAEKEST